VIESLESKQNCLLESPTGTGKTLSLLCASLGWLERKKNDIKHVCNAKSEVGKEIDDDTENILSSDDNKSIPESPKIYYCTRTHRQISQVIKELRKTKYKNMKMSILSSRKHTCINPDISSTPNVTDACHNLLSSGVCTYDMPRKSDLSHAINKLDRSGPWDIEDLVHALTPLPSCPYFCSRSLARSADIIFCPYDYLLDPLNRSATSLEVTNHVIILDEAHNIEDASREAASFTITEHQLKNARDDLEGLRIIGFEPESCGTLIVMIDGILRVMQLTLSRLVRAGETTQPTQVWTGREICGLMATVGLGPEQMIGQSNAYQKLSASIMENENNEDWRRYKIRDANNNNGNNQFQPKPTHRTLHFFNALFTVLNYMFRDNMCHLSDYRVVLVETVGYEKQVDKESILDSNESAGVKLDAWLTKKHVKPRFVENRELSLNFWCLNPSVVFSQLASMAHCVILMSGTLSPLDSLEAELSVSFPLRLEANHVISSDRLLVTTLSHGPNGIRLCATYQHQNTYTFQDEIGAVAVNACRIVPGGVLCFLPSYSLLDKLVQRWELTGLLNQLNMIKRVMIEPRSSVGLDDWLSEFYASVNQTILNDKVKSRRKSISQIDNDDSISSCTSKKNSLLSNQTGSIIFAVCRGKVSEGLDFTDSYARLVIAIGIPYPAFTNPQVQQKREFNDALHKSFSAKSICTENHIRSPSRNLNLSLENANDANIAVDMSTSPNASPSLLRPKRVLTGSEWYDAQAYRALNQALGRCIRHANDWGSILLADARFVEQPSRYMCGISRWIRSRVNHHRSWNSLESQLQSFITSHENQEKVEKQVEDLAEIFS
ncbi:Fanconi anemia group J protein, partial [Schistosoma japonicum]